MGFLYSGMFFQVGIMSFEFRAAESMTVPALGCDAPLSHCGLQPAEPAFLVRFMANLTTVFFHKTDV